MLPPIRTQHNLFELDFNVKFPLLRLLQFLSDLKSTINAIHQKHYHEFITRTHKFK